MSPVSKLPLSLGDKQGRYLRAPLAPYIIGGAYMPYSAELALWLRADSLGLGNAVQVSSWTNEGNKLGTGYDAVWPGSNLGPYHMVGMQNGLPAVQWDYGSNDSYYLVVTDNAAWDMSQSWSFYCVCRINASAPYWYNSILGQWPGSTPKWYLGWNSNSYQSVHFHFNGNRFVERASNNYSTSLQNVFCLLTVINDGSTGSMSFRINKTDMGSFTLYTDYQTVSAPLQIGLAESGKFNGYIGELAFFTEMHDSAFRYAVEAYLWGKWGLTA